MLRSVIELPISTPGNGLSADSPLAFTASASMPMSHFVQRFIVSANVFNVYSFG
jgi:hypothetical protein